MTTDEAIKAKIKALASQRNKLRENYYDLEFKIEELLSEQEKLEEKIGELQSEIDRFSALKLSEAV